jgi:hypothetical protein
MEIDPPQPTFPDTAKDPPRGRGYLAVLLLWIGILLIITMIAWVMLWSGGVKQAASGDPGSAAAGAKMREQQRQ